MNESRYVQACTDLVNGVCNAYEWVPLPGQSWMTMQDALEISAAIGVVWAVAWGFPVVARMLK